MKKIIIAPDKFKDSLSGLAFCNIVEEGLKKHLEEVEIKKLPLADGGDGTVEVLEYYMGGKRVELEVRDPLMRKIKAQYLLSPEKGMAFIEMADASGIRLLKKEEANPMHANTFGTGELIKHAIENGAKHIIMGIGGSATNDAGMGMARALGFQLFDKDNNKLEGRGADLAKLHHIDDSQVSPLLKSTRFEIACDVDNPLYGPNGAAHIYAPQKGGNTQMVDELNNGLINFNEVAKNYKHINLQEMAGAGAAGGLGAGSIVFLNATLKSGIDLIKSIADFDQQIKGFHWIISGEGKLDQQTFSGKVIKGVLDAREDQKLALFCGLSELEEHEIKEHHINHLDEMISYAKNTDDSIKNSAVYLMQAAENFAKEIIT